MRGVTTTSAFDSITAIRWRACDCQGSTAIFLNRSIASAGSPFSVSRIEAVENWAWAAGSLAGNLLVECLPGGDGLVEFLLGHEALADPEQDLGHARVQRVLGDEVGPGGAGLGEIAAGSTWSAAIRSSVSRIARWASALWGPLGNRAR